MRAAKPRWGEVTIKKQGNRKNKFDITKSFSVIIGDKEYSINDYFDILKLTTDLTDKFSASELRQKLKMILGGQVG